jgi:hypothetical protein
LILLTFHWARVVWSRTIVQLAAEEQRRRVVAQQQSRTLLDNVNKPSTSERPSNLDAGTPPNSEDGR